jgi:hypothetical protein
LPDVPCLALGIGEVVAKIEAGHRSGERAHQCEIRAQSPDPNLPGLTQNFRILKPNGNSNRVDSRANSIISVDD